MHRLVILSSYPQDMPRHVILMLLKVHKSSSNFHHRTFTDVTLISLRDTNVITHTSITNYLPYNTHRQHECHSMFFMNCEATFTEYTQTWHVHGLQIWMSLHVHELQTCDMNVITCTWIANVTWIAKQRSRNTQRAVILICWGHRLDNMVTPNPPFLTPLVLEVSPPTL